MKSILHLDSSAKKEGSATHVLSAGIVETLKAQNPGVSVVYRNLAVDPIPHMSPEFIAGMFGDATFADHDSMKRSAALLAELQAADCIVVGAPMYNFNVSSYLKAWIDHILRAGITFKYTDSGPIGLVTGKSAIFAVASGGVYTEGDMVAFDHVGAYLKQIFGFIGITDTTLIRAERQAYGPEAAKAAVDEALAAFKAQAKSLA
jgi:FMN-dependent NADH-azoreductase